MTVLSWVDQKFIFKDVLQNLGQFMMVVVEQPLDGNALGNALAKSEFVTNRNFRQVAPIPFDN